MGDLSLTVQQDDAVKPFIAYQQIRKAPGDPVRDLFGNALLHQRGQHFRIFGHEHPCAWAPA